MSNCSENEQGNATDLNLESELSSQLAAVRKRDRVAMLVAGVAVGLLLTLGVGYYMADARANSENAGIFPGFGAGNASGLIQYASTNGAGSAAGGGSCCSSGSAGTGSGGCGAAGTSLGSTSLADLEKQALDKYVKETGVKDMTAKAKDFGCHIQVDISDKTGKIIRSYGFQGGPLYVIK